MLTIWPSTVWTSVAQPTAQNGHTLGVTLASRDPERLRLRDDRREVDARADQPAERRAAAAGERKTKHIAA